MLARPDLLLPLAFSVSGLLVVAALVLLSVSIRQAKQLQQVVPTRTRARTRARKMTLPQTQLLAPSASFENGSESSRRHERIATMHMFSGATAAALDEMARPSPARQRQVRVYM